MRTFVSLEFASQIIYSFDLAAREGLQWNPCLPASTFLHLINRRSVTAMRLLSYFKQIPEFSTLNIFDRVTLIKYNLIPLLTISATLWYNPEANQDTETDSDAPLDHNICINVHGIDIYTQILKIIKTFRNIALYDETIIELALIIFLFSKGFSPINADPEPILNDEMAVYCAQKYYTELLWKYIETNHGPERVIHIFAALVAHLISLQTLKGTLCDHIRLNLTPRDVNELVPLMKVLLQIG